MRTPYERQMDSSQVKDCDRLASKAVFVARFLKAFGGVLGTLRRTRGVATRAIWTMALQADPSWHTLGATRQLIGGRHEAAQEHSGNAQRERKVNGAHEDAHKPIRAMRKGLPGSSHGQEWRYAPKPRDDEKRAGG
mmetsp:Transcript_21505/g.59172  ORF Transcript_21505/g.59172 Transcript_21505/m.59172 type:complete len:136 (+) Transcript_21505:103-510(+)